MIANIEEVVIQKFRQLSVEKQDDVLQFINLIEQDVSAKPTKQEIKEAREILNRAKKRALANPEKSLSQLWDEFNQVKNTIAQEYETNKNSN